MTTRQALPLPAGTYWCSIVSYADGSGLLGVYGPYPTPEAAGSHAGQLRAAGVHPHSGIWEIMPLHMIDLGWSPEVKPGDPGYSDIAITGGTEQ